MKLSQCIPGTFVSLAFDNKSRPQNVGQIFPGITLNNLEEVLVYVKWPEELYPQSVHPGNLKLYKD